MNLFSIEDITTIIISISRNSSDGSTLDRWVGFLREVLVGKGCPLLFILWGSSSSLENPLPLVKLEVASTVDDMATPLGSVLPVRYHSLGYIDADFPYP